jgi:hypothetical protein
VRNVDADARVSDAPDWPISVLSDFFFSKATHQTVVFESFRPRVARFGGRPVSEPGAFPRVSHDLFPNLGAR